MSYKNSGAYIVRPDGTKVYSFESVDELNALLARAESAEKMCDHWEARAKAAEAERDELKRKLSKREDERRALQSKADIMHAELKKPGTICALPVAVDWQRVRIDAAIAAMQGILLGRGFSALLATTVSPETKAAELAADYANALVAELKKEVAE